MSGGAAMEAGSSSGYRSVREQLGLPAGQTLLARMLAYRDLAPARVCFERIDASPRGELRTTPFTLSQILEGARAIAARLAEANIGVGERILLCLPNTERFLEAFLGIHWLGAIPVPLPSLSAFAGKAALVDRVRGVLGDCQPRAVLADAGTCRSLTELLAGVGSATLFESDATMAEGRAALARGFARLPHEAAPDDTAFIQYTSGSTGTPRGVLVTHGNLSSNMRAIGSRVRCTGEDRTLSWLPVYHDMGLIGGVATPLYEGHTCLLMSPVAFLARPVNWIRALSTFRATVSIAPNFAYSLCLRKLRDADLEGLDLSAWRIGYNGAEPIDPEVARGFAERFGRYGFPPNTMYPVYGLAEATLAVSCPEPCEPLHIDVIDREALARGRAVPTAPGPGSVSLVAVGTAVPGVRVEIRREDGDAVLPDRSLGEIVVRGPSVSPGYFSVDGAGEKVEWLRTGDLGYLTDGRLFVVDRLKDLIICAGRNHAPSDLERSIFPVSGIRAGRAVAFGVHDVDTGTDAIVVVAESPLRDLAAMERVRAELTAVIARDHGASVREAVLVEPGTLPRTSSGKVQRRKTRDLYLARQLSPAGSASRLRRLWNRFRLLLAARRLLAER